MTLDQLVFSFNGRINRAKYWAVYGVFIVLGVINLMFVFHDMKPMMSQMQASVAQCSQFTDPSAKRNCMQQNQTQMEEQFNASRSTASKIVTWAIYLVCFWIGVVIGVKRLHDLNKTGWLYLLFFIPLVNIGMLIWVGFFKGTNGPNQYGPDPITEKVTLK